MYCSSLACPRLPGGRAPNATISFAYCSTRLPLMSGLGVALAESASGVTAGAVGGAFVAAAGLISADASDGVCLLHPELTAATRTSRQRTSAEKVIRRGFMLPTIVNGEVNLPQRHRDTESQSHRVTESQRRFEDFSCPVIPCLPGFLILISPCALCPEPECPWPAAHPWRCKTFSGCH